MEICGGGEPRIRTFMLGFVTLREFACIATTAQIVPGDLDDVTEPMPADAGDYPLESSRHSRICH